MRHHREKRELGRSRNGRRALLRSLARSLILHGRIQTTEAKAKELRPFVERLVTYGKQDSVAARRLARKRLGGNPESVKKLFSTIAPQYKERHGGYTRIVKMPVRGGVGRTRALIEFV